MARILDPAVARLKREIALVPLVEATGVALRKQGSDFVGRCPFHPDKTPSLVISPVKQLWHCFGACNKGGSVIDWVMQAERVSFRQALALLQAKGATAATPPPPAGARRATSEKLPPLPWDPEDQRLLQQVVAYYHATLKESPEALAYLQARGLRAAEMLETFQLGYANRTLPYRLPAHWTQEGTALRERLTRLGILRATSHEHFHGCVVIPILSDAGEILGMYGRRINDHRPAGTPTHLYRPGPHRGVWNVAALQASKDIILCEALIDALTFWCAGYRHVTASYGVNGFTAEHLAAFKQYGTARVLIAYDRDAAGDRAAATLAEQLMAEGIGCARVEFPKGMDANEYALKVRPAEKSLGLLLQHARWLGGPTPAQPEEVIVMPSPPPDAPLPAAARVAPPPDESDPPPPSPVAPPPVAAAPQASTEAKLDELIIQFGPRRYRIRGLAKNLSVEQLKVNLLVSCDDRFHVDTLDLYAARPRTGFIKHAALELAVEEATIKKELGQVLRTLEERQEHQIRETLAPKTAGVTLTPEERDVALALLQDPRLLDRVLADFDRCGLVGEETNKLLGYLALVSRKLDEPLAILIQSSSAAGKSSLLDALLAFVPEEERIQYSAMTGQALFYMGAKDLRHKVLAIVEEEGAERAAYALKLLQSDGALTIASTGKDPQTGKLVTHEYCVEGPVMLLLTTTALEIGEELQNRCLVLTVNEDREQTRAIHRRQREAQTLEGLLARQDRSDLLRVHRNAQRLLRPLLVANPYARELTFLDTRTRTRRDHLKYLTLIRSLALLHQYQRPIKTIEHHGTLIEYVDVTLDDLAIANRLAHESLGRSLDELPPQTRRLLGLLEAMVKGACEREKVARSDYRFRRKDVRQYTGWSDFQVKLHLRKLESLEYVLVHHGKRGQSFVYELLYDGQGADGQPFVPGLLDVEALRLRYESQKEPPPEGLEPRNRKLEPPGSPHSAPKERGWSSPENGENRQPDAAFAAVTSDSAENTLQGTPREGR
ncbi:MAG: CHC2 zinc finger domain-containing protein [Nitrospiraceae bacterium]